MLFYIFITALVTLYLYYRVKYSRFTKYGVKHYQPFPLVGNFGPVIFQQKHFGNGLSAVYFGFPGERFVGYYECVNPIILVRDIELIKQIAIHDFESFHDHRLFISEDIDPVFGRVLFNLRGNEWKSMHSTLSPLFTSSKLKQMHPIIVEVGDHFISTLMKMIGESKTDYLDVDIKDLSHRFANDIAAACAFGLKVDSISEPNNKFYTMAHKVATVSTVDLLKFLGYYSIPNIMKLLKISYLTPDTKDFVVNLVLNTMKDRANQNVVRPDLIHLLTEARTAWSDDHLVAQAILVIIASHETISTTLTFLLFELALNPDIQDKLAQEINMYKEMTGGHFDYNTIQTMPYLDMVLSELLRLWPPIVATDRLCTNDYNLGKPNDDASEDFIVKVGEDLLIPIMAIHRDPQYFPDPQKFDPERFSEKNKHKIKPFTYIPFGLGPRNCIGYRFTVCGIKALVVHLLQLIEVVPCSRTAMSVQLSAESVTLNIKGGHWLRLKSRI